MHPLTINLLIIREREVIILAAVPRYEYCSSFLRRAHAAFGTVPTLFIFAEKSEERPESAAFSVTGVLRPCFGAAVGEFFATRSRGEVWLLVLWPSLLRGNRRKVLQFNMIMFVLACSEHLWEI